MAWKFENPLYSLTTEDQNARARDVWEGESLGGIMEDNHRLPKPVVWLLGLTIITAFLVTAPLWGQRPSAAIYADYVSLMDSSEIMAIQDDASKMSRIVDTVKSNPNNKYEALQDRHPLEMDDLRMIKDQIIELKNAGADLEEYSVIGPVVELANFEGEEKANGEKSRKQPWWDLGYTIDIFYVTYFCIAVIIAVKRLPNHEWEPDHSKAH